jgi:hypothetical protein
LKRAYGSHDRQVVLVVAARRDRFAAGNRGLQQADVVERLPGLKLADGQGLLAGELHGSDQ